MGVIKELVDHDEVKFADNGGFISPSGLAFIGGCMWERVCGCGGVGGGWVSESLPTIFPLQPGLLRWVGGWCQSCDGTGPGRVGWKGWR